MLERAISLFAPEPLRRSLRWCIDHVQTHEGRPYDHHAYPHLGAPGGPFDAFDDPHVQAIWLQFASRLGKTFFGSCCLIIAGATNPCPMMFASSVEKLAKEVVERLYKMIDRCRPLAHQLRPVKMRAKHCIDLNACRIYVGWSQSVSSLADKDVRVGHGAEIDKWIHNKTSREADPQKLFTDRFKNYPSHKKVLESTPAVKGESRVEAGRLGSTNCHLHVPCPHCWHFQVLRFEGIVWDKLPGGKHDKELARKTARYLCQKCKGACLREHRAWMMRRGVWCPEGCTVKHKAARKVVTNLLDELAADAAGDGASASDGYEWAGWSKASWIKGTPVRDGVDAGYQLSSLYALSLGWGDIAAEFVACLGKPQLYRNFINQWLGETWEVHKKQQTWEQLGARIIDYSIGRGIVPTWASLVTMGVDRQLDRFALVADAYGPGRHSATIEYGYFATLGEIKELIELAWPHADGGVPVRCSLALFDSGYRPAGVGDFCKECVAAGLQVWPCRGSTTSLSADYKVVKLGENTSMPGMYLFHVDTIRTQGWIDAQLHSLERDDVGGASLYGAALEEHEDFLKQSLNDAPFIDLDTHNNSRESWNRIDETIPNEYRDCRRYAYAAMLAVTRGGPIFERVAAPVAPTPAQRTPRLTMPDGRPFLITERD